MQLNIHSQDKKLLKTVINSLWVQFRVVISFYETSDIKKEKERKKEASCSVYQLGLHYHEFFIFFIMIMKQHGMHDIKVTDKTRAIR